MPSFESELGSISADRRSGSRTIAAAIARLLVTGAVPSPLPRAKFVAIARLILARTPAFALVFDLLHHLGTSLFAKGDSQEAEGAQFRAAVEAWRVGWSAAQEAITRHAASRLGDGMTVATISNSKAVCDLLLAVGARQDRLQVMVSESEPGGEGVAFAHSLEQSPHHVTLLADGALLARLEQADRVILGADAVFTDGVANKVGSLALAQAARRLGRELWVIAESQKWAPKAWGVKTARVEMPVAQKTGGKPASTSVLLFESVAAPLVTLLVSEHGSEPFARVAQELDKKPVFGPLVVL